jgi:N-acetylmuramoyl-L-alanine amidase
MSNYYWILDAGHGGLDLGHYVTAPAKMFTFPDGLEIYEGVINRGILQKVIQSLTAKEIRWNACYENVRDTSLRERVAIADDFYSRDKSCILLSVHSNAGGGSGFEVFTSPGQTKSDKIAHIFCERYKKHFHNHPLRSDFADGDADKEADFYILRKTDCPAILVENLFFDNRTEAEYLLSPEGKQAIANCIVDAILTCEQLKPI